MGLEDKVYLDGLGIKFQPFLLVDQELLHIFALIALKLNHLAHFGVVDNGAIASCSRAGVSVMLMFRCGGGSGLDGGVVPNFFLMTLRIFF